MFVVRHAKAGSRSRWEGDDTRRPLSKTGRRQADGLVAMLGNEPIGRIVSSPYVRCRQTVVPLAERLLLPIAIDDRLAEGHGPDGVLALAREPREGPGVLCTHGDVITELLERLGREGLDLGDAPCEKGSTWALTLDGDEVVKARYLPPPAWP